MTATTLVINFETPIVVKPLAPGDAWCLRIQLGGPADSNLSDTFMVGGYVASAPSTRTRRSRG